MVTQSQIVNGKSTESRWTFHYCATCKAHNDTFGGRVGRGCGVSLVGLVMLLAPLLTGLALPIPAIVLIIAGIVLMIAGFVLMIVLMDKATRAAKRMCKPSCGCVGPAVAYSDWSGTVHTFDIPSPVYGRIFAEANQASLVNVDALTKAWLDAAPVVSVPAHKARLARQTGGGVTVAFDTPATTRRENAPAPPSVADEIERLAGLRERGILTPEEFLFKKRQLLGIPEAATASGVCPNCRVARRSGDTECGFCGFVLPER